MMSRKNCIYSLLILLSFIFILSFSSIKVSAEGEVSTNGIGSGVTGTVDQNASATGVSKNRSGYLVYLANKDTGAVTSPVVLVPYNSAQFIGSAHNQK